MFILLALSCITADGWNVEAMAAIEHERLAQLDRLTFDVTLSEHNAPPDAKFDPAQWSVHPDWSFPFKVKIVRPNCLVEFLRDEPEIGYVPVISSVRDGDQVSRWVRPNRHGQDFFVIAYRQPAALCLKWQPLLQVLDIHFQDCSEPQLNIARLLSEPEWQAELVSSNDTCATYRANVPMNGFAAEYEFDLNAAGTPQRVLATLHIIDNPDARPITWEQRTLATQTVNGAELVTEAVVVVHNPNVQAPYESVGVHHYVLSNVQVDDTLTQDSITITPTTTNAWIWEYFADGRQHSRSYGPDGELLGEQFVRGGPEPLGPGETFVPRRALAWRWVIPPVAALSGLGAVFLPRRVAPWPEPARSA